ncbi:MAG TPA: SRPBCC domain-containing protein [Candidatus Dormibacteraeota bacterium]|nr:SRPBCC domain-containing protein [Candidatus Dormibacteraeota bacterium]
MAEESKHDLSITRVVDAPLERVWQAWTDPDELQKWWGPRGVTNPTCEWEARPGGKMNVVMLAGESLGELKGQEWPMTGEFKEVVPRQKLVFTSSAIMDGKPILENLCTVTLQDQDGKTKLTLQIVVTKATPEAEGPLAGMAQGWNESIDKLTEQLEQRV